MNTHRIGSSNQGLALPIVLLIGAVFVGLFIPKVSCCPSCDGTGSQPLAPALLATIVTLGPPVDCAACHGCGKITPCQRLFRISPIRKSGLDESN